ncbi:MAG: hypothetical protein LC733_10800, partial [Actinobacteria bacterium]|nr:hypothetical protein [Actinomycetota bacterium]
MRSPKGTVATVLALLALVISGCRDADRQPAEEPRPPPKVDTARLAIMDFPFFAPRGPVGELRLTSVGAHSESGNYVEMNFTPLLVYESRVTPAFKPPVDCGPEYPSKIATTTPCTRSITTPRGRVIHRYDRLPPLDASLYVLLGETLISVKVNDTPLFQRD